MKTKHLFALFGLSACFACSLLVNPAIYKTRVTPPESDLPNTNHDDGINQSNAQLQVTFDLNGGTYNGAATFTLNDVLPSSYFKGLADRAPGSSGMDITYPNPNYEFKGYSLAEDDPNIINSKYVVESNLTVYAQYVPKTSAECTVTWFDVDGSTTLSQETYAVGDTPTFKGELPIHEGTTFDHWNPAPSKITSTNPINYVAIYVPASRYHTVTLDYNRAQEELNTQKVLHNEKLTRPDITYTGYHLVNWTYVTGGTVGSEFNFDTPITSDDIKIKANWEIDTCNITYIANGGTISSSIKSVNYGSTITSAPTLNDRPGYDKNAVTWWTTETFAAGTQFTFGTTGATTVTGDLTLYAKWPSITQCTVTFQGNGGTWSDSSTYKNITVNYNEIVYPPTNPTLADNTFIGWYTQATGGSLVDFSLPITAAKTVYAHWNVTTFCTITFDSDGGSAASSITLAKGTSIAKSSLPTSTKTGYTFSKWTINGADVSDPYILNSNVTFKAVWTVKQFTVQFQPNGGTWSGGSGTGNKDVTGNFATMPTLNETISKGDYVFTGWKRASDSGIGIIPFDAEGSGSYVETYVAQWGGTIYHKVTFDSDGGSAVVAQNVIENNYATEPAKPTRNGYTFNYWYSTSSSTAFNFTTTKITADITLHAKWTQDTYTVTWYDDNGITVLDSNTYQYGAGLVLPASPTKFEINNRFFFKQWLPNAVAGAPVTGNMEFYASYNRYAENDIEFKYSNETYTIDGESTIDEIFAYGDLISYTFDNAPAKVLLIVTDASREFIPSSGYSYSSSSGVITINTKDPEIRNATKITLTID